MQTMCLVAGGAGFVGSALVRELLQQGKRVVSFDNYSVGARENLVGLPGDLHIVQGDVLDRRSLIETIRKYKCTKILNCVGDTFVPECYDNAGRFITNNLVACLNVLEAARSCNVDRIVYVSSTEVYGDAEDRCLDEAAPLNAFNTYAVTKLAADRLCGTFAIEHETPVVIARIFNCYGPRSTHPYIIPETIRQLGIGGPLQLGSLTPARDFTYVDDTARALILLMDATICPGECVNVGSGMTYSISSLVSRIAAIMGMEMPSIELDPSRIRRREIASFRCNYNKLHQMTSWQPEVSLDDGLSRTIDWWRANGCKWIWERSNLVLEPCVEMSENAVD